MIALKKPTECSLFARLIEPYIDGELDPGHAADMEGHVLECSLCSERVALARATRQSLKRTAERRAPDALRKKLCAAMAEEKQRANRAAHDDDLTTPKPIALRYVAALAAAAGVVFAVGVTRTRATVDREPNVLREEASKGQALTEDATAAGVDTLLDDLVALHKHPLPPEMTNPEDLGRFDPLVGVPVRRPAFQPFGGHFNGARLHAMRDRRAALLQYTVEGEHRVTVYVFDPRAVPMMRATSLTARVVRERPVYIGKRGGYSIAAAERSGVGYALATDLDDDESTRLVLAATQ